MKPNNSWQKSESITKCTQINTHSHYRRIKTINGGESGQNKIHNNMKAFGHTKTLFIQWWKYKWACHYDHCIKCLWVSFKHKWNWLCTSCRDKERANDPNRIITRRNASLKWHTTNKPRKPREEWAKMWPKPKWLFDKKVYQKEWYEKNKVYLVTIKKWKYWQSKWIPCISYRGYPLPLQDLDKPWTIHDISDREREIRMNAWKERIHLFDIMRIYIDKKLSKK